MLRDKENGRAGDGALARVNATAEATGWVSAPWAGGPGRSGAGWGGTAVRTRDGSGPLGDITT
jgi:hypothetical protein